MFDTISSSWKPFKNIKSAFYFMLKTLFVLKIFEFFSWLYGHARKWLDKKTKVNFKIYDVIDCKQTITIHKLPNISKSKEN